MVSCNDKFFITNVVATAGWTDGVRSWQWQGLLSSPLHWDRDWGPLDLLSKGYRELLHQR
jgi:hypothetical protein